MTWLSYGPGMAIRTSYLWQAPLPYANDQLFGHSYPMDTLTLARRLKTLRRTVEMLRTELRHGHLDEELITAIDAQLEDGIGTDPRSAELRGYVDALRESTLTPRAELLVDTIRACDKLSDAIEGVVAKLG